MNAKEISDSTLESVTPADNDLMLIYDTSEGTTGKATIADIAPKVAENIDIIDGVITYSQTNATGILEVFAKKYGRIAEIHALILGCNLIANTLTEIAITNLLPLDSSWKLVTMDHSILGQRCFLDANGSIKVIVPENITLNVRIDCVYLCK